MTEAKLWQMMEIPSELNLMGRKSTNKLLGEAC